MTKEIYFTNHDGRAALGPYTADEIQPQLRAQKFLGYPDRTVFRVLATSQADAMARVQSELRRSSTGN